MASVSALFVCCDVTAFELTEIGPGLLLHNGILELADPENAGDIANSVVIIGQESVAVVDTGGSATVGEKLYDAVRAKTSLPIRYVINTHFHPDHVMGNAAFDVLGVEFVGHWKLERSLADRANHYLAAMSELTGKHSNDNKIVLPSILVDDQLELDLGGRRIVVQAWPTAHTNADLTVLDLNTDTFVAGDLVFRKHLPVVDGSLNGWIELSDKLRGIRVERVIPGHGPLAHSWAEALDWQDAYLSSLRADLRLAIHEGIDLHEANDVISYDQGEWLLGEEFHSRNVVAGYTELEWE